jgi:hypothetical protein
MKPAKLKEHLKYVHPENASKHVLFFSPPEKKVTFKKAGTLPKLGFSI